MPEPLPPTEPPAPQISGDIAAGAPLRRTWTRSIAIALLVSVLLHALFLTGVFVHALLNPTVRVTFESSVGIALMQRLGEWEARETTPVPEVIVELEPEPQPEPEEPEEPEAEEPEADPEPEEAEEPEADPEPPPVATEPVAPTPEEVAAQREAEAREREERRARRERRRLRAEAEARRAAELEAAQVESEPFAAPEPEEEPEEAPDLRPPAERYPEGTRHPVATDLSMWGPEGARVVVVVRNDRLRGSPHRRNVESLLGGLPDWRTLVGGANLDPIDDVDAMVIASTDPRWVNQTFLAAVHRLPPDAVADLLGAGVPGGVSWVEEDGRLFGRPPDEVRRRDPRIFVLARDDLFLYTRPEYIRPLMRGAPSPRGLDATRARLLGEDGEDTASERPRLEDGRLDLSGVERRSTGAVRAGQPIPLRGDGWINGLLQVARFGGPGATGPAVMVTLTGFQTLSISGLGNGAPPGEVHLSLGADTDPAFAGRLVFSTPEEARIFVDRWPRILNANRVQLGLVGLYQTFEGFELVADHNEVLFEAQIPRSVVRNFATTVSVMMANRR